MRARVCVCVCLCVCVCVRERERERERQRQRQTESLNTQLAEKGSPIFTLTDSDTYNSAKAKVASRAADGLSG